jgi:GntR family transcriptional regulator
MKISLDYSSSMPMYEQIKEAIKENIYKGYLENNDALPSIRQLAKELDVSMITTKRAYADLEHEGFIYTISGRGTFIKVQDLSKAVSDRREKLLVEYKQYLIILKEAGIKKQYLMNLIEESYGE